MALIIDSTSIRHTAPKPVKVVRIVRTYRAQKAQGVCFVADGRKCALLVKGDPRTALESLFPFAAVSVARARQLWLIA